MKTLAKSRIGLALGSGAARGWAHIGVMHALGELGIKPDIICGTSIGALVGGFYLKGDLATLEDWARRLTKLKMIRYLDFKLASNGMIAGKRLFAEMESRLGDTLIESLPIPFAGVATDLHTGHEVWLTEGELAPAIRASFSLPGLFEPVRIDQRWMVDGALVNPVPVSVCHALGAHVVIAINLNTAPMRSAKSQLDGFAAARPTPLPGWPTSLLRPKVPKSADRRKSVGRRKRDESDLATPSLIGVLASTMNLVQDRVTRSRMAADPPDVNIVPKVGHIGLLDFYSASDCIDAGMTAVHLAEPDIREAIAVFEEAVQ